MKTYWELVKNLTLRDIRIRYKQSFLGLFWVILNPLFQMVILSFVFSYILRTSPAGIPYPAFIYAGLLPWIFFSTSLSNSMDVLVGSAPLMRKIYFPREVLVLSTLLAKVFDLALSLLVFVGLLSWFHIPWTPYILLFFPIFLIQFIFTYALALALSAFNLFYRDIQYLFNLILTIWFYLTPVLYATEFFPEKYRWIFAFNPMSVFINAYREVIFAGDWPNVVSLSIGIVISVGLFLISFSLFKRLEKSFADIA